MTRIFLFSDSHFGASGGEEETRKIELFCDFVRRAEEEGDGLVLLGDIFDFWFEYRRCVPSDYFRVIDCLYGVAKRIKVDYVVGNHDLWADGYFETLGIRVHRESLELELGGKRFLLAHGDKLRKTDLGGRAVRFIMGNRVSTFLYGLLHPDLGIALARWVSKLSRLNSSRMSLRNPVPDVVRELRRGSYDGIVMGHYHLPYLGRVEKGYFMIIGDWMRHFTYGVLSEKEISLCHFLTGEIQTLELD